MVRFFEYSPAEMTPSAAHSPVAVQLDRAAPAETEPVELAGSAAVVPL